MKKKNPIYFMPNGPILNNKEKWKIIIPGISLKLHSDRAMVGYYLLAQSSTYHQNFSDTHLAPENIVIIIYMLTQAEIKYQYFTSPT